MKGDRRKVRPSKGGTRESPSAPRVLRQVARGTADRQHPRVYHILRGDATAVRSSPTGKVGHLFTGEGLEVVWVSKDHEQIDPGWFVSSAVDLIVVLQGRLRVEFANPRFRPRILGRGDFLVLPGSTGCRAYRWPRSARSATVFIAAYPIAHSKSRRK